MTELIVISEILKPAFSRRKSESFVFHNIWEIEQWRDEKLIKVVRQSNTCTAEGLNHLLDVYFHAEAASSTWYIAIFESDTTPVDGTTYATPVYTESTAYDEATRPEYDEAAASNKSITNSASKGEFTMNATKTIYGGSLVDNSTKGNTGAAGAVLFCASKFASSIDTVSTDVLKAQVTITVADT